MPAAPARLPTSRGRDMLGSGPLASLCLPRPRRSCGDWSMVGPGVGALQTRVWVTRWAGPCGAAAADGGRVRRGSGVPQHAHCCPSKRPRAVVPWRHRFPPGAPRYRQHDRHCCCALKALHGVSCLCRPDRGQRSAGTGPTVLSAASTLGFGQKWQRPVLWTKGRARGRGRPAAWVMLTGTQGGVGLLVTAWPWGHLHSLWGESEHR